MKILTSKAEIIPQSPGEVGIYKQIELVGRSCWASDHLIDENSYQQFMNSLKERGHSSPFEHGTVYLTIMVGSPMYDSQYLSRFSVVNFFKTNPYSRVVEKHYDVATGAPEHIANYIVNNGPTIVYYITTNYRVIYERFKDLHNLETKWSKLENDLDLGSFITEPTENHIRRVTVHFTCQRAISAEFNRHRKNSIMERSSRYCNFSKEKFGNEIGIVAPDWIGNGSVFEFEGYINGMANYGTVEWTKFDYWVFANAACEWAYMNLLREGAKPEEARDILPMDLQTELYHTAFVDDWEHFFKLRAWKSKGNVPHPEAMKLARELYDKFVEQGYVSSALRFDNEIA